MSDSTVAGLPQISGFTVGLYHILSSAVRLVYITKTHNQRSYGLIKTHFYTSVFLFMKKKNLPTKLKGCFMQRASCKDTIELLVNDYY